MMRVARMNERTQSLPVLLVLLPDEVVFVGKRPPDVGMGSQPGYDVADVALVDLSGQVAVSPAVVGMEEDHVSLDAELGEVCNALFQVPEEVRVDPSEVEASVSEPLE